MVLIIRKLEMLLNLNNIRLSLVANGVVSDDITKIKMLSQLVTVSVLV